jgi:hypothetical protein
LLRHFFIFFSPVDIFDSPSHCCLVSFLLARPFSFIHFKLRRFFSNNWFDWCSILIQSDLNFFPLLLTSCLSNSLSPCCQLIFFLLDHFRFLRFFDHFFSFIRLKLYTFLFAIYLNCVISWLAWSFLVRSLFITQYSLPARRFVAWYSVCPSLNINVWAIRLFPEMLVCVSRGCVIKQFNLRLVLLSFD